MASESAKARLRVLIAGGGTGGHIVPALAIARELRDTHGAEVRLVGTSRGLESRLVPEAGFPLDLIRVGQLKNVSVMTRLRTFTDLPLGVLQCLRILRRFRPDVVVGVGGYASGPGMVAAILLRVPTLAFEPNAVPGLANRLVGKLVSAAAVNFEETRRYFRRARATGIPVRAEFFQRSPRSHAGLRLLVTGASQGARVLNEVVPKIAARLLGAVPGLEIVHQTGGRHGDSTRDAYECEGLVEEPRLRVQTYLDDMAREFVEADLILCRSGANTVAEVAAAGRASVLVPFAQAADDHQRKNADVLVAAGAAELILESELTEERLFGVLHGLLKDDARRSAMGQRVRALAHPEALKEIGEMVVKLARR